MKMKTQTLDYEINFSDLNWKLQLAIVFTYIWIGILGLAFLIGFIEGIIGG